jgi:hypothetical protein
MYAWLLGRRGKARNGYYYTDEGIEIADVGGLMCNKYKRFRIIGLVWRLDPDSPYLCEVSISGRKHYLAVVF